MTAGTWVALRARFDDAAELSGDERETLLDRLEETDSGMAVLLRDLLQSSGSELLATPPWQPPRDTLNTPHLDSATRAFHVGEVLNYRFEIENFLGSGGAGEVYSAWDRHRRTRIALKTIRAFLPGDPSSVAVLRNELNTAAQVSHNNICRLYDITVAPEEAGASFITMELLEGESLAQRLRNGPFRSDEAHSIAVQLIDGLAAAHARGIVHRDLKPSNVILVLSDPGFRAVITDFGLAHEVTHELTSDAGPIAGTPAYMAPEQLAGKPATTASDIYSLGLILREMATGTLKARWGRAVTACLAKDPEDRPASAAAILPLLHPLPARRALIAASAVAMVLLAAGALFVATRPAPHRPEAEAAVQQGLLFNQRSTAAENTSAIRAFSRAAELEPRWAQAWAYLADAYATASNIPSMEPALALAKGRQAAERAIQLDARLPGAHAALARTQALDLDEWPRAGMEFRRAIQLDDRDARTRAAYSTYLRRLGRYREAWQQVTVAMKLTNSTNPRFWSEELLILSSKRDLAAFHSQTAEAHRLFPNDAFLEVMLALSLELRGQSEEAMKVLDYVERLGSDPAAVLGRKAEVAALSGDFAAARSFAARIEAIRRTRPVDDMILARVYARLGDNDKAFSVIAAAWQARDNPMLSLASDASFEKLHGDPRFASWLLKLRFTREIIRAMDNPLPGY
jgi:tetratricopeptide (TPR) repeat protein